MYETNISTAEFLYIVYIKVNVQAKELLRLYKMKSNSKKKQEDIAKIKENIIEVFYNLSINSNSQELKRSYIYLASLIVIGKIDNINQVIDFCEKQTLVNLN